MTIVRKVEASAEVSDDLTFVLSDATLDRYGDTIEVDGWDLRWFRRNPIALFGHDSGFPIGTWDNVRVEGGKLLGRLKFAAEGTSERIDELRRLVEQKVLRAVSVGFKPIETEPLANGKGGIRYIKQELLETSLVSVPANPAALSVARSMHISDDTMRLAFGEQAGPAGDRGRGTSGENAAPPHSHRTKTMRLSERIQAAEAALVQDKDALTDLVAKDDADPIEIEELTARIEEREGSLAALKRAETALAAKASQPATVAAQPARRPLGVAGKDTKPGELIIRSAVAHALAHVTGASAEQVVSRLYGDDEGTMMIVRAAVAPATTTTTGWAAELVNTAMDDFLETLRPVSVYPALAAAGGGRLAFGPNQGAIKIPARAATPSIGGSFVGEGSAIPVRRLGLTSVTLTPRKMGVISTFTREIARYSTPAIEALLRNEIVADTAITLDSLLLDTVAGDAVRPTGLLNGVTPLTATAGGGYGAILGDIRKLRAPFDAANAATGLMLLMNPAQAEALDLTPGADGTLGWAAGIIARYGVAVSTAIPAGTLIMVRATDFVTATGDVPEFELSDQATLHMEDTAPAAIGTAGTPNAVAAPVRSLFQTATTAIRMLMDVSWAMRRTGMVQTITGATW